MTDLNLTIYPDIEQRSPEWHALRCGLVTASTVGRLITVSAPGADAYDCPECGAAAGLPCVSLRGGADIKTMHPGRHSTAAEQAATAAPIFGVDDGDTARGLLMTLAAERITGHVEEGPITSDMWRGIDSEPFARDAYAEHTKTDVAEVGFMIRDLGTCKLGWSPDGLITDDGGIEIKAPRAKGHIQTILDDAVPAHHMPQIQAALLVSGREWCDYVSFHGGMHLWTKRVYPDPAWFAAITEATEHAEKFISDVVARYQAATKGLPMTDRIPDPFADVELKLS